VPIEPRLRRGRASPRAVAKEGATYHSLILIIRPEKSVLGPILPTGVRLEHGAQVPVPLRFG